MVQAYSHLERVLSERRMSVPELRRRILRRGVNVNLKSLYRLSKERQPLERLDLRVAGAICQACEVPLSRLIVFEAGDTTLRRLPMARQKRLNTLMSKNSSGRLTKAERVELESLVREAEEVTFNNARALAGQRQRLAAN
jgi:DNA-binding Xre family transcriptional regulator